MLKAIWFVLAGMAIVFATLSFLALAMTVLNRWLTPEARTRSGGRSRPHGRPVTKARDG